MKFDELRQRTIIAIDPDVDKNGVAKANTQDKAITIQTLNFYETIKYITEQHDQHPNLLVVIEAGWLNKSNWHLLQHDSRQVIAAKGKAQGRNEQVSKVLGEMMQGLQINYQYQKPLRKVWRGKDKKITQQELQQLTGQQLPRTNQEGRDAALILWTYL